MPRKQLELQPAAARSFAKDICAYFAEKSTIKKDEIADRQLWLLKQYYPGKLRITDVREMFVQMKDEI
jgi:hypothetical protein